MGPKSKTNVDLRNLPSVDELLRSDAGLEAAQALGPSTAARYARRAIETVRSEVIDGGKSERDALLSRACELLSSEVRSEDRSGVRRVINATGVVIHTNLGRAPLAAEARAAIVEAAGYCTLEFDAETGHRGRRGRRAEKLAAELAGAEEAVIVNNGAAAAFLVLSALAAGGEVVISRGELVEIGGDFRVPDVLAVSGAALREVGTTNRTKISDYARAIGETTKLLLRVHPSNYRIVGFAATPTRRELAELGHERGILVYEDLGSGALADMRQYGIDDEPVVADAIADGVDIVSFSGDKLLGGPQAGIIAGRKEIVDRVRKHPLYRVLRSDKLTYAALEATLLLHLRGDRDAIPVLKQLGSTSKVIEERAKKMLASIPADGPLEAEIVDGFSAVGGGAAPTSKIPTRLIALSHRTRSPEQLEVRLRMRSIPVIARIEADRVLIDLRTVDEADEAELTEAIASLAG